MNAVWGILPAFEGRLATLGNEDYRTCKRFDGELTALSSNSIAPVLHAAWDRLWLSSGNGSWRSAQLVFGQLVRQVAARQTKAACGFGLRAMRRLQHPHNYSLLDRREQRAQIQARGQRRDPVEAG